MRPSVYFLLPLTLASCADKKRVLEVHEFPEGFKGWAIVVYEQPNQPALIIRDGELVARYPGTGTLHTSSKQQFEAGMFKHYFIDAAGNRIGEAKTHGGVSGDISRGGKTMKYFIHFVGTDAQYNATARSPDAITQFTFDMLP